MNGKEKQNKSAAGTLGSPNHTEDYQYGDANWKDKLTARVINGVSYPVVSDAIGNITAYAGWTYTWQAGRQLASQTNSGGTVEYKYNADGLRVQKKRGSTVTDYVLSGKNIAHMTVTGGHTLHFYYDAQDRPAQVQYNGTMYRYVHSLQGDILAILDSAGNTVVQYAYDAWGGKKTTTGSMAGTLGYYNPFRYRGYVWDEETWMYYLRSRYYYPELQRFISADSVIGIKSRSLSHNLWAYCYNSPIQHADSSGQVVGLIVVLSISFGGILFLDQYIANMNGLTRQEKELSRAYPVQAAIAKRAAESADRLTNEYFGPNATIADTTRANAFKHAVWNAIMVRDLGVNFAAGFASAHEENDLKNTSVYQPGLTSATTTVQLASIMDLHNNERGRYVGAQSLPWFSDDKIAQLVKNDMLLNPDKYTIIATNEYNEFIK